MVRSCGLQCCNAAYCLSLTSICCCLNQKSGHKRPPSTLCPFATVAASAMEISKCAKSHCVIKQRSHNSCCYNYIRELPWEWEHIGLVVHFELWKYFLEVKCNYIERFLILCLTPCTYAVRDTWTLRWSFLCVWFFLSSQNQMFATFAKVYDVEQTMAERCKVSFLDYIKIGTQFPSFSSSAFSIRSDGL